jgi:hypothetical protein
MNTASKLRSSKLDPGRDEHTVSPEQQTGVVSTPKRLVAAG